MVLKTARINLGLSQKELAYEAKITAKTISRHERGKMSGANSATVRRLAAALGLTIQELTREESIGVPRPERKAPAPAHTGTGKTAKNSSRTTAASRSRGEVQPALSPLAAEAERKAVEDQRWLRMYGVGLRMGPLRLPIM